MTSKTPPLIVIVGETASGKSSLGMEIARHFKGEIISSDSWAIYKSMDIGTAKPSLEEQAEIPHHEIDVVWPDGKLVNPTGREDTDAPNSYTAAVFQTNAKQHIRDVASRGNLPMIVGGTGLYVDSVLFDYQFGETGDKQSREMYNKMDLSELVELVEQKKYDTTAIDIKNKRRVIRLLETAGQDPGRSSSVRPNTLVLGVSRPRNELRKRVELRTELMFKQGLRREVKEITDKYGWDCEGMQGIGYKEFIAWHEGGKSMTQVKHDITRNTLNKLAKHQRTWFKRHQFIQWVDNHEDAIAKVREFLV